MSTLLSKTSAALGVVVAVSLLTLSTGSDALTQKKTKDQPFSKTSAFIDFSKLGDKKSPKSSKLKPLGRVDFKSIKKKPKGKPKKDTVIRFGEPIPSSAGRPTVDIELVSLSLVSVNPVSLDPLGGTGDGKVFLSLSTSKKSKGKGLITFDDKTKKTGKFDATFNKFLKLKAKDGKKKKKKPILEGKNKLPLEGVDIAFRQQSPVTVTGPFCLGSSDAAQFCLSPLNAVPEPPTWLLLSLGVVGMVAAVGYGRRRVASA